MDYSSVRQSSSFGSTVSVNHRALITRALTKYPVDHALFRELLQNSADARANSATIQFSTSSTDSSPLGIHTIPISRLTFMNDGAEFNDSDWARLKEIASGNPNESKIGAFGVGFYSVFELTDEPLIHSGNKIVNFKYKGVQLHYNETASQKHQKGTLIDLPYKQPGTLGDVGNFIGFLIQNFMLINLNEINLVIVYGNGAKRTVLRLLKSKGKNLPMKKPTAFRGIQSPFFALKEVKMTCFTVQFQYMNAALYPHASKEQALSLQRASEYTSFPCQLNRVDATIAVSVKQDFKERITESLLKPPPSLTTISMLSISDQPTVSPLNEKLNPYVFPEDVSDAKIFIGFATNQSTGFMSHLALQSAIPTMERTALDLAHQYVKDWNIQLLRMAGLVVRIAYENELIRCMQNSSMTDKNKLLIEHAKLVCSKFKFHASAPDKTISEYIKDGFYSSSDVTLVPTTRGILPNARVRYTDESISGILRKLPIIDDTKLAKYFSEHFIIAKATPSEIADDICDKPLKLPQAKKYVEWLEEHWSEFSEKDKVKLKGFIINTDSNILLNMKYMTSYYDISVLNLGSISSFPQCCIPAPIAQELGHKRLQAVFGIAPLEVLDCVQVWINSLENALNSPNSAAEFSNRFANEILEIVNLAWPKLDQNKRNSLVKLLSPKSFIPTENMGLKRPIEAYIEPIKGFTNIPLASRKFSPTLLENLGVRRSLSMNIVLNGLSSGEISWSNKDLIKYLCENQKKLQESDWNLLKTECFFERANSRSRFRPSDLYAPDPLLQELRMPVLVQEGWSANSAEAEFMYKLGLKRFPPESRLMNQGIAIKKTNVAIDYFMQHFREAKYVATSIQNIEFLPTTKNGILASPANCYTDSDVEIFEEKILDSEYEYASNTLGVTKAPSTSRLIHKVAEDPKKYLTDESKRDCIFAYFSKRIEELNSADIELCKKKKIIPAIDPYTVSTAWYRPNEVFLPYAGDPEYDIIRPILPTYSASKRTLAFLSCLDVTDLPDARQLAQQLIQNPVAAFKKLDNCELYEQALTMIGKRWSSCIGDDPDLISKMKQSQFLLGEKIDPTNGEKKTSLYYPSELAIVDDSIIYNQFKNVVVIAPQDTKVELIYHQLNVPTLSSLLEEGYTAGAEINDPETCKALKQRIAERLKLFIEYTKSTLLTKNTNVKIKLVRGISLQRQLPPHPSITLPTTCYWDSMKDILLIDPEKIDWLDVAYALSKKFLQKPNQDAVVVLELQLSASLSILARKGYSIERLRGRRKPGQVSLESLLNRSQGQPQIPVTNTNTDDEKSSGLGGYLPRWINNWWYGSGSNEDRIGAPPSFSAGNQKRKRCQLEQMQSFDSILAQGITKLRKFDNATLKTQNYVDPPAVPAAQLDESCGSGEKHELFYVYTINNGVKVYRDAENTQPRQNERELSEILLWLAKVFNVPPECVSIFREQSSTIAFNQNGSLFFNSYQLPDTSTSLDYWYTIMAHELAHNLCPAHNSLHSFYTEGYIRSTLRQYVTSSSKL